MNCYLKEIKYDKQTAFLFKGSCHDNGSVFQLGKSSLTPENTQAIAEALEAGNL